MRLKIMRLCHLDLLYRKALSRKRKKEKRNEKFKL